MAFQIRKEYATALVFILALFIFIWGFKFLKGVNVLSTNQTFYVKYPEVDQLRPSSPVMINGLEVGLVKDMYVDPEDDKSIIVELNLNGKIDIPKNTVATIVGLTAMGGRAIDLEIQGACSGGDCAQSGEYLSGKLKSFLQTVMGDPSELDAYSDKLKYALTTVYDSISDPNDPKGLGKTLLSVNEATRNLAVMTGKINRMLDASSAGISATAKNTAEITGAIKANNANISNALKNLEALTLQLKESDIKKSVNSAGMALDTATQTFADLSRTIEDLQMTLLRTDTLVSRLNDGQGTAGKMLTDDALYVNLTSSIRQMQLLAQDLRINPKRYNTVKLKLFGKNKTPNYLNPLDDPAYQMMIDSLERDFMMKQRNGLKN
jgi:phospholipid/cholesterol/gamma-HCH transport system substrate-binding protein